MAAKKTTPKGLSDAEKVSIGIGLTAAAVAAAGAYFLYGSKGAADNRKKVKGWTLKAKGEVLEALEHAKEISADEYQTLVKTAVDTYGTVNRATKGEMKDFQAEMSEHWNKLQKNKVVKKITKKVGAVVSPGATAPKAAVKKAPAKKSAKKTTA